MLICQCCYVASVNQAQYSCFLVGEFYQQQLDLPVTSRVYREFSDNMGWGPLRQPCVHFIFMKI